jgi:hypothetical protein
MHRWVPRFLRSLCVYAWGQSTVLKNVVKRTQTCSLSTRFTLMPSLFAKALIACSITADWLMPRLSESFFSKVCAVSLNRILVFFCAMLTGYHKIWYNASTWKPTRYRVGVPVVASSARKTLVESGPRWHSNV